MSYPAPASALDLTLLPRLDEWRELPGHLLVKDASGAHAWADGEASRGSKVDDIASAAPGWALAVEIRPCGRSEATFRAYASGSVIRRPTPPWPGHRLLVRVDHPLAKSLPPRKSRRATRDREMRDHKDLRAGTRLRNAASAVARAAGTLPALAPAGAGDAPSMSDGVLPLTEETRLGTAVGVSPFPRRH